MELLTVKQAAEQLGVSRETVYSMIGDKTISLASVQIIPALTGRIKKYFAHIEKSEIDRLLLERGGKGRLPRFFSKRAVKSIPSLTAPNK